MKSRITYVITVTFDGPIDIENVHMISTERKFIKDVVDIMEQTYSNERMPGIVRIREVPMETAVDITKCKVLKTIRVPLKEKNER